MGFSGKYAIAAIILVLAAAALFFALGSGKTVVLKEGQREGPFLVQKIYQDSVEVLYSADDKLQRRPVTMKTGSIVSDGSALTLKLVSIINGTAVFQKLKDIQGL